MQVNSYLSEILQFCYLKYTLADETVKLGITMPFLNKEVLEVTQFLCLLEHSVDIIQGYPQRMRLQGQLNGISLSFVWSFIITNCKSF